jgi:small multidrug resistance pump
MGVFFISKDALAKFDQILLAQGMIYFVLAIAVCFEVLGTSMLPATQNFTRFVPTVATLVSYAISFYLLTLALRDIPLAVVYATWSGMGVFLVACIGYFIYAQALQWQTVLGLILIVAGVILVNLYSTLH